MGIMRRRAGFGLLLWGAMALLPRYDAGADSFQEPPAVTSVTPAGGAAEVSVHSPSISAVFSEAMDASSLTGTSFTVTGTAGTVSYDDGSRTATFTPADPLAESTIYTAIVSGAVKSAAGAALGENFGWSFTTTSNVTVIGNGTYRVDGSTEPRDRPIGPNTQVYLDAFDLAVAGGAADRITAVTVQAAPEGISAAIAKVEITDGGGVVKGVLKDPASESWTVPVAGIVANGSQWLVRVTTRSELPEGSFNLTGTVTSVDSTLHNRIETDDTTSATLTIEGVRPEPRTFTGSMIFPAVSSEFLAVQITFDGDSPLYLANNSCTLSWGETSGTYPHTAATTRNGSTYSAAISGLTRGTTYHFEARFSDRDGVTGTNPVRASQATMP